MERLNFDKNADSGCWEVETTESQRYGRLKVDGKATLAHRYAYRSEVGEIGDKFVLHECDNPACVNPDHLYLGTQSDNMQDMYDRDRREPLKGEDNPLSVITEDMVIEIRERYDNEDVTQSELAEDYPIGRTGIGAIVRRETWRDVD